MRGLTMALVTALGVAAACGGQDKENHRDGQDDVDEPLFDPAIPGEIMASRSLALTDDLILKGSPGRGTGSWTFGGLMRGMLPPGATNHQVSEFVKNWLIHWSNGRPGVREQVLCPWLDASNGLAGCRNGDLKLELAPFKLIGIVNRMDLHQADHCEDAGELRFAFAFVGQGHEEKPLTVVFEYAIPTHEFSVAAWAGQWAMLSSFTCVVGDCEDYRSTLESLTQMVTAMKRDRRNDQGNDMALNKKRAPSNEAEDEDFEGDNAPLISNLRHLRIHDAAFGKTEFREYDWRRRESGTFAGIELAASLTAQGGLPDPNVPTVEVKCFSCHTPADAEGGAIGERFNLVPGLTASERMNPAIAALMPGRAERLSELTASTCEPVGGDAQREVPW